MVRENDAVDLCGGGLASSIRVQYAFDDYGREPRRVVRISGKVFRTLFDQRSRAAACWQGAREASELNPTLSARQSGPIPVDLHRKLTRTPMMPTWFGRTYESSFESAAPVRSFDAGIDFR